MFFLKRNSGTKNFFSGHPTKVAVALDMIDPGKNEIWHGDSQCIVLLIYHVKHIGGGDNNPGHSENLSLLLKI